MFKIKKIISLYIVVFLALIAVVAFAIHYVYLGFNESGITLFDKVLKAGAIQLLFFAFGAATIALYQSYKIAVMRFNENIKEINKINNSKFIRNVFLSIFLFILLVLFLGKMGLFS